MGKIVKDRIIYGGTPYLSAETGDVLSVDENGNVVGVDPDTLDTKVTQTQDDSTDNNFEVLLAGSTSTSTATEEAKKTSGFVFNPLQQAITIGSRKANSTIGEGSFASGYNVEASSDSAHAEGSFTEASGVYAHAEGNSTTASGESSHAEGDSTEASGVCAHAEGHHTTASNDSAHAEGYGTTASAPLSHAEGYNTIASGDLAHAEGGITTASGIQSHAEGFTATASGNSAHAEGSGTTASGDFAHAEGYNTIANHKSQHVFGEYNIADPSTETASSRGNYVEIVGNGASGTPSNARTLDWDGNEWLAGKLTVGAAPTNNMDVATKQYADSKVNKSGDTMTGQLDIQGTAASKPLRTRGIVGSNGSGSDGELHLQYGNSTDDSILFGNTGGGHITSNGTLYSGWSGGLQLPRVSKSCNFRPGINKINVEEYQNDSANLPSAHWYHIYTSEGSDSNYACQLALGMTTDAAYYRRYNNGTWTSWQSLVNTNTTYSIATGDNNGQIKVTPSSGSAYNVSVKGLGSAAYVNADTAATANTIAKRQGNGYLYAVYYNTSCGVENPASYTSYPAFIDSNGWLRKSSAANMRSALSLGSLATLSSISDYISVGSVSYDNLSISANNSAQTGNVATTKSGWTALGIIGVSLANASSSGTLYSWCSVYQYAMNSNKQVYAQVRNHYTGGAAKIKVQWFILYIK